MRTRSQLLFAVTLAIAIPAIVHGQSADSLRLNSPALAKDRAAKSAGSSNEEFFAVGTLQRVRRKDTGAIRMAITDDAQQIQAFIAPTARIPLEDFVGQEVGISARTFSQQDDIAPFVMVEEIVPISGANVTSPTLLSRLERADRQQQSTRPQETGSGVQQASAVMPATNNRWSVSDEHIVAPTSGHIVGQCDDPNCSTCGGGPVYSQPSTFEYAPQGYGVYDEGILGGCTGASCTSSGCTTCGGNRGDCGCGPPGWLWVRGEYLLWWADGMDLPPLVTTSTTGTPEAVAGVLGQPSTQILYGNEEALTEGRSGFRIRFGGWFGQCRRIGWEADYFDLGDISSNYGIDGDTLGNPIIARPFYNVLLPGEDSQLISFPGRVAGDIDVDTFSQFNGAGGRFRWNLCCKKGNRSRCDHRCGYPPYCKVDFSLGYRYLGLDEGLTVQEDIVTLTDPTTNFQIQDSFLTRNDFHGAEIGTIWDAGWNRLSLELASKMSIGSTRHQVSIDGSTTTLPGTTSTGGLLAQRSNIGSYDQNDLSIIPELSSTLGFYLTPRLRFTVGYTIIYWSNVVRPGDQIDLDLNPNLLPPEQAGVNALRPDFTFRTTDYWAQGLNIGLDLHW